VSLFPVPQNVSFKSWQTKRTRVKKNSIEKFDRNRVFHTQKHCHCYFAMVTVCLHHRQDHILKAYVSSVPEYCAVVRLNFYSLS